MKLAARITLLASALGVDIKALTAKFSDYAPKTGVPGDFTTGGKLTAGQVNLKGQTDAETESFSLVAVFGVGIQIARSWIATNAGELYNQGNAKVKSDGVLSLQGSSVNVTGQMTVNNGVKFGDGSALSTNPFVPVANFAALPASVTTPALYYVQSDAQNPDSSGNPQPSLYILSGSTKLWLPLTPV